MDKKERFTAAFAYLKDKGLVRTQKDLADRIGTTAPNVSSALKGVESVLTDRFLERFCLAYSDVFNPMWLLTGEGEMLRSAPAVEAGTDRLLTMLEEKDRDLRKKDEQIDRLIALLEKSTTPLASRVG